MGRVRPGWTRPEVGELAKARAEHLDDEADGRQPQCNMSAPIELVLSGYPLMWRQMGTGVYTARLIRGLLRRAPGKAFRVLTPEPLRDAVLAEFPAEIFDFVPGRPPIDRSIARDIYWGIQIVRQVRRKYARAIFHSPGSMWAPVRAPCAVITHYDCVYRHFPRMQGGVVRSWWWRASERYARSAQRLLTISQYSRTQLMRYACVPEARIEVIYPWVDTIAAEEACERMSAGALALRYGLPPEYLLYVGGYTYNKNVERLIAAYARAAAHSELPPLVLVGGVPPADPRLALCDVRGAIAEARLRPEQIRLIGAVDVGDLAAVFRGARLLVSPSLHEGFGYPAAEAMALGTPVIASNSTSLVEVVRDPRCRFDATSIESIASKLLEASAAPAEFRRALPREFTEEVGIASYLEMLDRLRRPST